MVHIDTSLTILVGRVVSIGTVASDYMNLETIALNDLMQDINCSLTLFIYLLFLLWQSCNFDLFANSMSTFTVSFFQKRKLLKVSIFLYIQI